MDFCCCFSLFVLPLKKKKTHSKPHVQTSGIRTVLRPYLLPSPFYCISPCPISGVPWQIAACCGTVSISHKKVADGSLFWQAGAPDVAFAGFCIALCFVFEGELSAVPNVRLLCRLCCCNRKFNKWFFSPLPLHCVN